VKNGEGVFGLRRAFLQAGARTLVTSLWKVPDDETVQLMTDFYTGWLEGHKGKAEALRQAQLKMIEGLEERHGFAHPYYWAGFVLIGDWR
jgi:CHAT domain-containing protein